MFNYSVKPASECQFHQITRMEDLPPGERLFIEINQQRIVLFNISGRIFAIGDVCSHDEGPVGDGEIDGMDIICPRHGAKFDIQSGKAISLPAVEDIPSYPVRVVDGMVEIGIPN